MEKGEFGECFRPVAEAMKTAYDAERKYREELDKLSIDDLYSLVARGEDIPPEDAAWSVARQCYPDSEIDQFAAYWGAVDYLRRARNPDPEQYQMSPADMIEVVLHTVDKLRKSAELRSSLGIR